MTLLMEIQADAQRVVNAICAALGMEVTISDTEYNLVASSRDYHASKGEKLNSAFKAELFRLGKTIVIDTPGKHPLCSGCIWEGKCPEKALILKPIFFKGKVIGDIGLTSLTEEQRYKLITMQDVYMQYLDQMAELLVVKLAERIAHNEMLIFMKQLKTIMDFTEEGLISIDEEGNIIHSNKIAAQLLNKQQGEVAGGKIESILPALPFQEIKNSKEEVWEGELIFSRCKTRFHLLTTARTVRVEGRLKAIIISIRDMGQVRDFVYKIGVSSKIYNFDDIIGESQPLQFVKDLAREVANSISTVLILGETGTGKELIARSIHYTSLRKHKPFIAVNCSAIPESLLESELFGYEGGAFTGAKKEGKPGKFELANGGTIFLDEIGDMPLYLQAKLLRVLQEKEIERLGSTRTVPLDVRVIAATHKDIEAMVGNGEFREDLYYRLNVIPIRMPPLRERIDDVPLLINHMVQKYAYLLNKNISSVSEDVIRIFLSYDWPGNIRELENSIEYAVNIEKTDTITSSSLPVRFYKLNKDLGLVDFIDSTNAMKKKLRNVERTQILAILNKYRSIPKGKEIAARELGFGRSTFYRKLKELGIE